MMLSSSLHDTNTKASTNMIWLQTKGEPRYRRAFPAFKTISDLERFYGRKVVNNQVLMGRANGRPIIGAVQNVPDGVPMTIVSYTDES